MIKLTAFFPLLITISRGVGAFVQAVRLWTATRKWLGARRAGRIGKLAAVVDVPERRFIPQLRQQLTRLLLDDELFEELEQAAKMAAPGASVIIKPLVRDLQIPEAYESKRLAIASEIAEALVQRVLNRGEQAQHVVLPLHPRAPNRLKSTLSSFEGSLSALNWFEGTPSACSGRTCLVVRQVCPARCWHGRPLRSLSSGWHHQLGYCC
ncbi:hypothetical protein [Hyalangium sp.]|uniref:hypothetical protein n=1 Tax=Hyalangium sp. TaxID=2028555 RepID=UPI002D2A2616|nr:hypothetical protein [Hyalangium sp.]HYH94977.1 hypothetical protein [Hyalangium sp.]